MNRRVLLGVAAAAGLAFNGLAGVDPSDAEKPVRGRLVRADLDDGKSRLQDPFEKCAKACAGCSLACESCFKHCADRVSGGNKAHSLTMHLCLDCAELCATAARLSARQGTLAGPACEACAKACDACAAECEKTPSDEHMRVCANSCRACAAACRQMIKNSHHQE